MSLSFLLGLAAIFGFGVYFFYKNGRARYYLLFVVYLLPLMNIKVVPFDYGGFTVFDMITIATVFIIPRAIFSRIKFLSGYTVIFTLFLIALILSSMASAYPSRSLFTLTTVITPFIYGSVLIREVIKDTNFMKEIVNGLRVTCSVALVFIFMQVLVGPSNFTFLEMLNQNVLGEGNIRYPGFFMDAQINGIFLAMVSFFCLFNFRKFGNIQYSQILLFSLVLVGLLLTGSRSAFIGFAGGIVLLIFFMKGNLRFHIVRYVALAGVLLFFSAGTINTFDRFQSIDKSYDFRANIWEGALDIFKEQPIFGIGMNNYKDYVRVHAQDQSILMDNNEVLYLDAPENGYLKYLVEWGIIAFIMFVLIILLPLFKLMSYYIRGFDVKMALLAAAPVIALSISNISVYAFADSRIIILLATALALVIVSTEYKISFNEQE